MLSNRIKPMHGLRNDDHSPEGGVTAAGQPSHGNGFMVRQPIIDANHHILGHDLCFRLDAGIPGADLVLPELNASICENIIALSQELPANHLLFLRIDPSLLRNAQLACLQPMAPVLTVDAAHIAAFDDLVPTCAELIQQGWRLAFDNLPDIPAAQALLTHAHFLRFGLRRYDAVELEQQIRALHKTGRATLIAAQVESDDEFEAARVLGFHAFQGYFFTQVQLAHPRRIDHDRLRIIRLLNLVAQHAEIAEMDNVIRRDTMLAYRLLTYINSPLSGLNRPLESIAQALYFLGYGPLYRWLTVLLFTSGDLDARDRLLLQQALIRARSCELAAKTSTLPINSDSAFIVGMFSLLDALLNVPMAQVVESLSLTESIQNALLEGTDRLADILNLVKGLEQGDVTLTANLAQTLHISTEQTNRIQLRAFAWAGSVDNLHEA